MSTLGEYWAGKAHSVSENRGKMLRRDGFGLASERYGAYILVSCEGLKRDVTFSYSGLQTHSRGGGKDP